MLKIKKKVVIILSIILFLTAVGAGLLFRENPNNSYRASGTSPSAHEIRIDDHFYVATVSATYSSLIFDDGESDSIVFTDKLVKLNWDNNYIIGSYLTELNSKELNYLILEKKTLQVKTYSTSKTFKQALNNKGIKLRLKNKRAFDWY